MEYALCIVVLMIGGYRQSLEIRGPVMHTNNSEIWMIDLTDFFKNNPKLIDKNNLVQEINPNSCLLVPK